MRADAREIRVQFAKLHVALLVVYSCLGIIGRVGNAVMVGRRRAKGEGRRAKAIISFYSRISSK